MDITPNIIERAGLDNGSFDLVEWRWPDMVDFVRTEPELMLEMSLPPHAADASAEFPEIAPNDHCFMGTLFVRYPRILIHGRGEGGHIRVLRCIYTGRAARSILGEMPVPDLSVLQSLLDIRSKSLRVAMGLALGEFTATESPSREALEAIHNLVAIKLRQLLARPHQSLPGGRLASWQYRRIRERLSMDDATPMAAELATICGISVRHLDRQFLALTGSTVGDYVTEFSIHRAKTMLNESEISINNIAFAIGFSHPNSFARAFRRATGMSPNQFRQRRRKDAATP